MLDILVQAPVSLAYGSDVRGSIEFYPGGSAANFAVWAARCGAQAFFFGALGTDFLGDYLLDDLRSEGVNCAGVVSLSGRSPSVLALVGPDGERTMVTDRRVTLSLDATYINCKELTGVQHLHLTGYSLFDPGPAAAAQAALECVRSTGARVSLDLSSSALLEAHGARRTRTEIAEMQPDVLFGNEPECMALCESTSLDSAIPLLSALSPVVVVKRGALGCVLIQRSGVLAVPTVVVEPRDTTGAGDAFAAAWVCSWLRGEGEQAACAEGNRLAVQVVLAPGARGAATI